MKRWYTIFILLISFVFIQETIAQSALSVHLTEKEGLPDKEFYDILEDDNGLIWLAADKGLYSYNGKEYTLHTHPEQIGSSVFWLTKDEDNTIWFTNLANQVFYVKNGKIEFFLNLKDHFNGLLITMSLSKNSIIFSYTRKIITCDKTTGRFISNQIVNDITTGTEIKDTKNDTVQFIDRDGYILSIGKSLKLKKSVDSYVSLDLKKISGRGFFNKLGKHYITSYNNIENSHFIHIVSENSRHKITTQLPIDARIHKIDVINNKLFYATSKGVFICSVNNHELVVEQHLLPNIEVTCSIRDHNKNYWFTTLYEGIYVMPNLNLKTEFKVPSHNVIRRMYLGEPNELFLVGKHREIYCLDVNSGQLHPILLNDTAYLKYLFYHQKSGHYFFKLTDRFDEVQRHSNTFSLIKAHVFPVFKDHYFVNNDTLLFATGSNYGAMTINDSIETPFRKTLRSFSCHYNAENKGSYFGTMQGLFLYEEQWNKKEIRHNNETIYIKDLVTLADGSLWALSFKKGLYKINHDKIEKHYSTNNGLLSNTNGFIAAHGSTLWIAGEMGLQQLDTETASFKNLTKKDGIPSYDFTGMQIINNKVYVSTVEQLFSFQTATIFDRQLPLKPTPYFTGVTIDSESQKLDQRLNLPHDNRSIEISFNTNGFRSHETIGYEYRLLDGSKRLTPWQQENSKSNSAIYNKLAQGNYTFQLRAIDGKNTSDILSLRFKVKGIFYKQWWFYSIITFIAIFISYRYFENKNKQLKERQQLIVASQKKDLENVHLKLESLRSQMNPHFIFNALNSIQDYIISNERKLARTYLIKFSRLIRMYLEHSQQDLITLHEELTALHLYLELEKDRFEDSFTYTVTIPEGIQTNQIKLPTFLVQPYVENAIKHGLLHKKDNRKLSVSFTINQTSDRLEITIDDNGIGRSASEIINNKKIFKPKSFSSNANRNRIALLNKTRKAPIHIVIDDIKDQAQNILGTTVTIQIPLKNH